MQNQPVHQMLEDLEKNLRMIGTHSNWILLDPIDPVLKEELSSVIHSLSTKDQEQLPEKPTEKKATIRPLFDAANENTENSFKNVSPIEQNTDNTAVNLDPRLAENLESLRFRLRDCAECALSMTRKTVVFGQGNHKASLLFVGEGPGAEEDSSGLAFVGKAGKLLTQMIHSIGLNREAVYICNVVKCRPPGNRNPKDIEIETCFPFLEKQIELIQPKLIVTLGNVATKALLNGAEGIMKIRGTLFQYNNIPLIPTFHPSFLLRQQSALDDAWTDFRKIRQVLFRPDR